MRELGELGMSIGTSLAFESDESKFNLQRTDNLYLNVRTLIRNAAGAYPKDDRMAWDANSIATAVLEDLKAIGDVMEPIIKNRAINLVIYYPSYSGLKSMFPKADLWEPTKEKQIQIAKLYQRVWEELKKRQPSLFTETNVTLPSFVGLCTVVTHHPVDLATCVGYQRLTLLESHTGTAKPYILWNTKLTGGNELFNIPLNKFTIQVFGDKSVNFKSSSHAIKTLVKDLAAEGKWTTMTSIERIRLTINTKTDGVTKAGLLLLL